MSQKQVDEILKSLTSSFFFDKTNNVILNLAAVAPYAKLNDLVGFLKLGNYAETPNAFYMRKDLDEARKKFIIERWNKFNWANNESLKSNFI